MPSARLIIDAANNVPAFFGTSAYGVARNAFQDGNLTGGVQATLLSAAWCNAVQQEILTVAENYASGPVGLTTGTPNELANSIDYSHINRAPIYSFSTTLTTASQTPANAILTGGSMAWSNLIRERTASRANIAAGATQDVVSISLPTNSQCLIQFWICVTQTDAITTNYMHQILTVSARNSGGTATVQSSATTYLHVPGIGYSVNLVTSTSSVTARVTAPGAPAGKFHNASGAVRMMNVHTAL